MSTRRLLVVATAPVDGELLRRQVREHAGEEATVRVVAPAAHISPLAWLVSDEDRAREEAEEIAQSAAGAVGGEAQVGDSDPVQAIEDALRTFAADEIILVTPPGSDANWLEKGAASEALDRFGLPVTHLISEPG